MGTGGGTFKATLMRNTAISWVGLVPTSIAE
jgi:hypothetical protein